MTTAASTEGTLVPVRVDLPRASARARARRLLRTFGVFGRHTAPVAARRLLRRGPNEGGFTHAVRLACEELGATYVKFGQFVGSAPDIVGEDVAREFRSFLDTGPPIDFRVVRQVLEADLQRPLHEVFTSFEERPLAAASIAVVHRAQLHDGRTVAVKVLRPGMDAVVASDLGLMQPLFRFLAMQGLEPSGDVYDFLVGLQQQVSEELDLRNEARSMVVFRKRFADLGLSLLVVPEVYEELSGRRVLTMEYLEGAPIDDLSRIAAYGVDPRPLVEQLLQAWVLTAVHYAAFHADIHAGNLILMPDGRLGMIDWGIVARLDRETHLVLWRLLEAALGIEEAWDGVAAHVMRVQGSALREGLGLNDDQVRRLVRSMLEPVLTQPVGEVSMASVFAGTDETIRLATGEPPVKRTLGDRWRSLARSRRAYRLQYEQRVSETEFRRAQFLAGKQLVYLERYWKMYLPDRALLGDKDFLRSVLHGDGTATRGRASATDRVAD